MPFLADNEAVGHALGESAPRGQEEAQAPAQAKWELLENQPPSWRRTRRPELASLCDCSCHTIQKKDDSEEL